MNWSINGGPAQRYEPSSLPRYTEPLVISCDLIYCTSYWSILGCRHVHSALPAQTRHLTSLKRQCFSAPSKKRTLTVRLTDTPFYLSNLHKSQLTELSRHWSLGLLQIQNALGRKEKEQTVEKLTKAFEESTAVFGIRFQNISVSADDDKSFF